MLKKHESMWLGDLGNPNFYGHTIDLQPYAKQFKSLPFRADLKTREMEQTEVVKQLKAGVIKQALSKYATQWLFARKKRGRMRFCVYYRKLNTMTENETYPLPRMDESIASVGEATIFTTLDAYDGYWEMLVRKEDLPKAYFVCRAGTYQHRLLPMWLCNSPASVYRSLDQIRTECKWKTCLFYIDDVIIYSKTLEEHISVVDKSLWYPTDPGFNLNIKKCSLFQRTFEYFGHTVEPGELEIDRENTELLRNAYPPTTKTQLVCFLGP